MNTFTLLTALGATGVIISFMSGVRATIRQGNDGRSHPRAAIAWRMMFDLAVFGTILVAPLAR
ncbi:MAG: hypothetical protein HY322_18790 [Betaproteobacteria bacterium]|nr:hypothetical protein [Betaproteobacteria bacterium]